VVRVWSFLRSPFSFLFANSQHEERVAAYVLREHDRGRTLGDILEDPFVRNRCSPHEISRLLERPDLIKGLGDDVVEAAQQTLTAR